MNASQPGSIGVGRDNRGNLNTGNQFFLNLYQAAEQGGASGEQLRRAYLAWLSLRANELPLAFGDSGEPLQLSSVYTALMTAGGDQGDVGHAGVTKRAEGFERTERQSVSALAALDQQPKLVLLGGPGSGKSTFLNFVALCLAGELLAAPTVNLNLLRTPLPKDPDDWRESEKTPEPQPWRHGALLPVRVILRDFVATLPKDGRSVGADDLWQFIAGSLPKQLQAYGPTLQQELLGQGGLILLDGLDEVPEAHERREQVKKAVQEFAAMYGACRFLVTSRTYAYQYQQWKLPGFVERELLPLSRGQIVCFIDAWYAHMARLARISEDQAGARAEILKRDTRRAELAEMAGRPLLLTLMARLQTRRAGNLPENREKLYAESVDMLLEQWEGLKARKNADGSWVVEEPSLSEWLQASREDIRKELDKLAYKAHAGQPELTGTADIRQDDVMLALVAASRNRGQQDACVLRLEEYLRDRAGLLNTHGEGLYQFPHRSFQEYLAACHLARTDFPDALVDLYQDEPGRWRETALLAAARMRDVAPNNIWELAECLCPEDAPDLSSPVPSVDAWGALLAGQVLVENGLAQPDPERPKRREDKRLRVRAWQLRLMQGRELPLRERALAGDLLAELGDPRFDPDRYALPVGDELGFVSVPADPDYRFGTRTADKDRPGVDDDEINDHLTPTPEFRIGRYPVTVAQYRAYLQATGRQPADPRTLRDPTSRPVRWVSWQDALDYCDWLQQRLCQEPALVNSLPGRLVQAGWRVMLPSELEWEKAARGGLAAARYPWGDEFGDDRANTAESGLNDTSTVGVFPENGFGLSDMIGNVWEWTRSPWRPYPYDGREDLKPGKSADKVVRGGGWVNDQSFARCACRYGAHPDGRSLFLGFRVVLCVSPV